MFIVVPFLNIVVKHKQLFKAFSAYFVKSRSLNAALLYANVHNVGGVLRQRKVAESLNYQQRHYQRYPHCGFAEVFKHFYHLTDPPCHKYIQT